MYATDTFTKDGKVGWMYSSHDETVLIGREKGQVKNLYLRRHFLIVSFLFWSLNEEVFNL
jgi:hypothetical protein